MVPSLLAETPAPILLLAFLVIGVGGILLVSHLFYGRFIAMVQEDPVPETGSDADSESSTESSAEADTKADAKAESTEPVTPGPNDLRGRVLTFTTLAFVFMLAFVLNTSWGNVQDAQYATQTEGAAIAQLLNLTDHFEDPQTAEAVQTAVLDYTNTIVNEQWPLLEVADGLGASAVGLTASTALGD
ncbi:MAG TPA: hypothetical protein DCQ36_01235, partial [Actinobacteria bacterium]|nr:hypothetical protein [Actinomycetota bacterium]